MPLSKSNTRILLNIPKDFLITVKKYAEIENRSVTNFIITALQQYINSKLK